MAPRCFLGIRDVQHNFAALLSGRWTFLPSSTSGVFPVSLPSGPVFAVCDAQLSDSVVLRDSYSSNITSSLSLTFSSLATAFMSIAAFWVFSFIYFACPHTKHRRACRCSNRSRSRPHCFLGPGSPGLDTPAVDAVDAVVPVPAHVGLSQLASFCVFEVISITNGIKYFVVWADIHWFHQFHCGLNCL